MDRGYCSVAGFAASVYAYVGEFNTEVNRATIVSWMSTGVGVAAIIQPLLAWWILSYDFSIELYEGYFFRPWRLLILAFITPGIIGFFWMLLRLKESPRYYLAQNEKAKALKIIRSLHKANKGSKHELEVDEIATERKPEEGKNGKGM